MKLIFKAVGRPENTPDSLWKDWKWQLKNMTKSFPQKNNPMFPTGATPYYLRLIEKAPVLKPIVERTDQEFAPGSQAMEDPLGENRHSPHPRLIHRYPDRVLYLLTDNCGVYCRYCTRKRWTGKRQSFLSKKEQEETLSYIKKHKGIREVILSGGDPLSLSDSLLEKILQNLRAIEHIEIIRVASRMPVVCPMRLTPSLLQIFKAHQPVFLMTHFNHPAELTQETQMALKETADSGILMFNQTVLLNKINNHPSVIQALMRRLLYLRVKPYYMFQCDPSEGSDHFRTSIPNSQWIQRELWGRFSGLALPNLSVDIPGGGGKVGITPDFTMKKDEKEWLFKGWDGWSAPYINPIEDSSSLEEEMDIEEYKKEWEILKNQSYGKI